MKGNIFSIEILLGIVVLISTLSLIYINEPINLDVSFEELKLISNKANTIYFYKPQEVVNPFRNCEVMTYYTDINTINTKTICEEII
jgi:hypothetical protein